MGHQICVLPTLGDTARQFSKVWVLFTQSPKACEDPCCAGAGARDLVCPYTLAILVITVVSNLHFHGN